MHRVPIKRVYRQTKLSTQLSLLGLLLSASIPSNAAEPQKTIQVDRIQVLGSTVFDTWELSNITQPYENRTLTLEEMQAAADAVTRYYLDHGYLTSRAILADQTLKNGQLQIQILEGKLADITIQGEKDLPQDYIKNRILRAGRQPLNQEALESQLQLLRSDPLFDRVEGVLRDGKTLNETNLDLKLQRAQPYFGQLQLDNYGNPTVGRLALSALTGLQNFSGFGDTLSLGLVRSNGTSLFNLNYQYPIRPNGSTLTLRLAPSQYRVTSPDLASLDITGSSQLYELAFRAPLKRQITQEFALTAKLSHRTGSTLIGDTLVAENSTNTLQLGQDWLKRDKRGLWTAQSQLNLGNATTDNTKGTFLSFSGQLQRLQILSKKQTLIADLHWQWSPHSLPPSQQFSLGGYQSLRGYTPSLLTGDNGFTFSLENQITLQKNRTGDPKLQLSPFLELGSTWTATPQNALQPPTNLFASTGLGLTWQPLTHWKIRVDLALPLTKNPTEPSQKPALYLNSNYRF